MVLFFNRCNSQELFHICCGRVKDIFRYFIEFLHPSKIYVKTLDPLQESVEMMAPPSTLQSILSRVEIRKIYNCFSQVQFPPMREIEVKAHILSIILLWRNTKRIFQHKKYSKNAMLGA